MTHRLVLSFVRRWQYLISLLVVGFVVWNLSAIGAAIFVPVVEMEEDWCVVWWEGNCVEFINSLEEDKYFHNKRMATRNAIVMTVALLIGVVWEYMIRFQIPHWKKNSPLHPYKDFFPGIFFALWAYSFWLIVVLLGCTFILPPPVDWYPDIFRDIRDAQVVQVMRVLTYY